MSIDDELAALRTERPKTDPFDTALLDVFEAILSPDTSGVDKAFAVARFRDEVKDLAMREARRYVRDAEVIG